MSKELHHTLKDAGMLEYGSHIPGEVVREVLGLEMPEIGTKEQFDAVALKELQAIDYVRNILLSEGKYLAGAPGGYRVLLPSENKAQVDAYMAQADRKLRRAQKLSRSMPSQNVNLADQTDARIMLKRDSMRGFGRLYPSIHQGMIQQAPCPAPADATATANARSSETARRAAGT